jgi:hypothetical protein
VSKLWGQRKRWGQSKVPEWALPFSSFLPVSECFKCLEPGHLVQRRILAMASIGDALLLNSR